MHQRLIFSCRPFSIRSCCLPFTETRPPAKSNFIISSNFFSKIHKSNVVSFICSILKRTPTDLKHLKKEDVHQLSHDEIDDVLLRCQSDPIVALAFFDWVRSEMGIKPGTQNYCTIVHILAWSRMFSQVMRLLGEVVETDRQVFDKLIRATKGCNWNPVVFDMLVKVYVHLGMVQIGVEAFRRMVGNGLIPHVNACNCLLNGLLKSSCDETQNLCWEIYEEMKRIGVSANAYTFNILTHALCKVGDFEKVKEFLEKLEDSGFDSDAVTYNTLIDSYCKKKKLDEAFYLYRIMYRRGIVPDLVTYTILTKGLCKEGRIKAAHQLFHNMQHRGIMPDCVTYNSLISGYCTEGKLQEAKSLFYEMIQTGVMPDNFTYVLLVESYIKGGRLLSVLNLVVEIQRLGLSIPDEIYITLIRALCLGRKPNAAKNLFTRILQGGYRPSLEIYNVLIESFCKDGNLNEALLLKEEIIDTGLRPDLDTYRFLIEGLSRTQKNKEGERLMQEMSDHFGLVPDSSIFSVLINEYCSEGNVMKAELLLQDFAGKFQVSASNYNSLIEVYCNEGNMQKAFELRDRMMKLGAVPNALTCKLLISGLSKGYT